MYNKRKYLLIILVTLIISLYFTSSFRSVVNTVIAQSSSSCYDRVVMPPLPSTSPRPLPVILVHGYAEDSSIWSYKWESRLQHDGIPYCTVTFQSGDDKCGAASTHSTELNQIVQKVKTLTQENHVNIVGHSKGGLDARVYLAQSQTPSVANLIMIGTPNGGDPLADLTVSSNIFNPWFYFLQSYFCTPALYDLETTAEDTKVRENTHTNYYTIYGDWNPDLPCSFYWFDTNNYNYLGEPNDGIVPMASVLSLVNHYANYINLGSTSHCHQDLFGDDEYNLTQNILKGR